MACGFEKELAKVLGSVTLSKPLRNIDSQFHVSLWVSKYVRDLLSHLITVKPEAERVSVGKRFTEESLNVRKT